MGLFSSKTKITVDTTISRVIEDNMLPDSVKTGLIKGIMKSDGQIVENILEDMGNSIAIKAERMYRYGQSGYVYGLPKATMTHSNTGMAVVEGVIESIEGREVTMSYNKYGAFNNIHFGWQTLVDVYGYDEYTNELTVLSAQKGTKVYLEDMYAVVPSTVIATMEKGALDQWGTPPNAGYTPLRPIPKPSKAVRAPTAFQVSAQATQEYLAVSYVWQPAPNVTHRAYMNILVPEDDPQAAYFQAKYTYQVFVERVFLIDTMTYEDRYRPVTRYFTYRELEGTYPEIDDIFRDAYTGIGSFFPWAYFRYEKDADIYERNPTAYNSSKRLLKYLNMDYEAVMTAINANPDIDDVEQAMMFMAVPADTSNPIELRYLYEFFFRVYVDSGSAGIPFSEMASNIQARMATLADLPEPPEISLVIRDARFKMSLSMNGIYRKRRAGTIASVGHHTMGSAEEVVTKTVDSVDENGNPSTYTWSVPVKYRYYRKQIAPGIYDELRVVGLKMKYHVWGGYTDAGNIRMVPLDYSITEEYNNRDREELYSRSLHFIFNSKIETKIKWYQQSWFRVVLIIIAIIITVFGDYSGSTLGAAIAAGTATLEMIVVALIVTGLEMLILNVAFKLFVKAIGAEAAMVLAIVVAVAGVVDAVNTGSLSGAPFAKDLLSLSTGLIKAAGNAYTDMLMGVKSEQEAFGLEMIEKNKELEVGQKLLEGQNILSPFVIFGESPTEYYDRTVHSGNIGVYSIDAISSYVDIALTLPKLPQSIGEV